MANAPGTLVVVKTNAFELKWPANNVIHHYDVIDPPSGARDKDAKIGHNKGMELMMRLQQQVRPEIFHPLGAYDGKKNLFSTRQYKFRAESFDVPWDSRPPIQGREQKKATIKITHVSSINVQVLKQFKRGDTSSLDRASIALNMLNLFVQSTPRMQEPNLHNAKSFFTSCGEGPKFDKIRPFQLWRGYFQSVRPGIDKIIVNVDVTAGVVIPAKKLEDLCLEHLRLRNLRDLSDRRHIGKLRLHLRGLKVEITLRSHAGKRPKTIKDVVSNVDAVAFDKNGEIVTIKEHFRRAHNYAIPKDCLGVLFGSGAIVPITVCRTVPQLYKNKSGLPPDLIKELLSFSPANPKLRLNAIEDGWSQLQYNQSPFLCEAGISIDKHPLEVKGRLLPNPTIEFQERDRLMPKRAGVWDIMNKKLRRPAKLSRWTVADFSDGNFAHVTSFLTGLRRAMGDRGMAVGEIGEKHVFRGNGQDFTTTMDKAWAQGQAEMILVILPESAAALYTDVKRYGDITRGVVTQCVKWSTKLRGDVERRNFRSVDQYYNNLILKINVKLGGSNSVPCGDIMRTLRATPTMVLGADVSHPGPGSRLPSVSALVASVDADFLRYVALSRIQEARTEMIVDLASMFETALQAFHALNKGALPRRIIFFRDGVSEGEFMTVKDMEMGAMQSVIERIYPQGSSPGLVFIVVGKRHHFRFFPVDDRGQETNAADFSGNGNLRAGFVVDTVIKHPVYDDFYLQSQPGLKGTSRPSHYTILKTTNDLSIEQLQEIAYALCHCYSRSTRSVKIPAPVYYADLVCRRARFHFDEDLRYEEFDAQSAHSHDDEQLSFFHQHFHNINQRMKGHMYFV